jgi:hypothetical protein
MSRFFRPAGAGLLALVVAFAPGCSGNTSRDAGETAGSAGADAAPPATSGPALPPSASSPSSSSPMDLRTEYTNLQQRLNGLQQKAMQDSVLKGQYDALEKTLETRMAAADPQLSAHRDRLAAIQQEMTAAKQAGQDDKFQSLLKEGTTIQNGLRQVREDAMTVEEVKTSMSAFRDSILAHMTALDPEVPTMVKRANDIAAQLRSGTAPPPGAQGGPGGNGAMTGDQ